MPFANPLAPNAALGLLGPVVEAAGFSCDLHHLYLRFADLDFEGYQEINDGVFFHGEWIFSHALWKTPAPVEREQTVAALGDLGMRLDYEVGQAFSGGPENDGFDAERYVALVQRTVARVEPFIAGCLDAVDWSAYDVVGFSSTFQQNVASLALARRIKERFPKTFIAFGGGNCDGEMGLAMLEAFDFIDGVCTGEGDQVFVRFLEGHFAAGRTPAIPGFAQRRKRLVVADQGAVKPSFTELDTLPTPDYDAYFEQLGQTSFSDRKATVYFETSRGCWWGAKNHCTFCGVNGSAMTSRQKSPDRAFDEITELVDRYRDRAEVFAAADNIIPINYSNELLPKLIEADLGVSFFYETKSNLKKHQLQLFRDAGLTAVQPGIESLQTSILKLMRKGVTGIQNVQFLKWARQYGVNAGWNILFDFPTENEADYEGMTALMDQLHHLTPPLVCTPIRIDRFSPHYEDASEFGLENLRAHPSYAQMYPPLAPALLDRVAYSFVADPRSPAVDLGYQDDVSDAACRWRRCASDAAKLMCEVGETVALGDFHPDRAPRYRVLDGERRQLFLACDGIAGQRTLLSILSKARGRPVPLDDLGALLDPLVQEGWMMRENGRYLSLCLDVDDMTPRGHGYLPPSSVWPHLATLEAQAVQSASLDAAQS